ncbi:uncharacterized protein B0I36DRAFT_342667 [Microdochium trichocladiopsis]|uniref:Zn(2)-C6 fungal-type domain-containing protein n=1 Tax=Microdochium trichocladiopsis TaxID=1682393 RepID=A0A9P8XPC9_9PEZI|nr:uncharacterized protein B0I36DRAFT_342667 [Microdochium trichocladiopsis]KAH7009244.1 hypothetical protein B0I36DRAFT_342667 [Microdochium trichocladiopsis]
MSPAHRQSCDRCRQQKVRCLRDNNASVSGPGRVSASLLCDRCAKAGAECRYSEKQRGHRRRCSAGSPSEMRSTDLFGLGPAFGHVDGTPGSSAGSSHFMTALMGHPSSDLHVDESKTAVGGFGAPDAEHDLLPLEMPPTSHESLATLLAEAVSASCMPGGPFYDATAPVPSMEADADYEDTRSFLFSRLTAVSQRAMRTARRLARSGTGAGATTLMVSSPEVTEALEDTNTLISTVNDIMTAVATAGCDDPMTTTGCAELAFLALACHQNLMTLFRAICDAIKGRLQAKKEEREQQHQQEQQRQQQHAARDNSGVGPLNVAQFVMVLQLLMHLISRMGRILEISNTTTEQESQFIAPAAMLDGNTMATDDYAIGSVPGQSSASSVTSAHHATRRSGLLEHVQEIVGNIPSERERLRRIIQRLQAEMDHAEIH